MSDAAGDQGRSSGSEPAGSMAQRPDFFQTLNVLVEIGAEAVIEATEAAAAVRAESSDVEGEPSSPLVISPFVAQEQLADASLLRAAKFVRSEGFASWLEPAKQLLEAASALESDERSALAELDAAGVAALTGWLRSFAAARRFAPNSTVLAAGPWVGTAVVQDYLGGLSRQTVHKRVSGRQLLAVKFRDGNLFYPTQQLRNGTTVPGLNAVLTELAKTTESPAAWATWLASPSRGESEPAVELPIQQGDRTWWDELAGGHVEAVLSGVQQSASPGGAASSSIKARPHVDTYRLGPRCSE